MEKIIYDEIYGLINQNLNLFKKFTQKTGINHWGIRFYWKLFD